MCMYIDKSGNDLSSLSIEDIRCFRQFFLQRLQADLPVFDNDRFFLKSAVLIDQTVYDIDSFLLFFTVIHVRMYLLFC